MNSPRKKILFILPTLSRGGQERIASRLSFALPDYFEKFLIVFYKDRVDYPFNGKIIFLNLPLFKGPIKIFAKIIFLFTRIFVVRKIKKEIKQNELPVYFKKDNQLKFAYELLKSWNTLKNY